MSSGLLRDTLRGDGGGGLTSLTSDKNNDEDFSFLRPCFVSRSRSMISGVKAMFSLVISDVVMDRSSGVKALFPPSGGTREGTANLELGTRLSEDDRIRASFLGVPGGDNLR